MVDPQTAGFSSKVSYTTVQSQRRFDPMWTFVRLDKIFCKTKSFARHCTAIKVFGITLFPHILPRRKDLFDLCPYCKLSRAGQWKGLGTKLVVQYTCFILDTNSPQMLLVLLNCTVTCSKLASLLLKLILLPIKHLMVMITFGV